MNRLIAIGLIITALAADSQAQQPTPARRTQAAATQKQSTPAAKPQRQAAQPTSSQVKPAVAVRSKSSAPIGTGVSSESKVVKASALQGEVVYDEQAPIPMHESSMSYGLPMDSGCASCDSGSCDGGCVAPSFATARPFRGFSICNPPPGSRQLCICLPSHGWVQMDYLHWFPKGMDIPALVATGVDNNAVVAGRFNQRQFLLGPGEILDDSIDGGRIRGGWWFANNPNMGIELEYLATGTQRFNYGVETADVAAGNLITRPFNNTAQNREDAFRVVSPNFNITGALDVDAYSRFEGGAVRLRRLICCGEQCKKSWIFCRSVSTQSRVDGTLGWRTLELSEGLSISSQTVQAGVQATNLTDSFTTKNIFHGGELGFMWQGRRGYWTLDALLRTSFGNTSSDVTIDGVSTVRTPPTSTAPVTGDGLFARATNEGSYSSNQFSVVPEIGLTLGYQLTERTRLTAGYTMIYWSNVARPGDQIDVNVNPAFTGAAADLRAPILSNIELSNYFIHGLNLGGEYRW